MKPNSFFWKYTSVLCLLFAVTFPIDYSVIPRTFSVVNPFFENLIYWSGTGIFGLENNFSTVISSDSIGLYIHVFNLLFLSLLLTFIWQIIQSNKPVNLRKYFFCISTYFLVLMLFKYGFDKVFKVQFYTPEPNTLFTNLGDLSPDILYWSAIGSSWGYSFFLGAVEVLVAVLLLFKKTRLLGILLGIGVMVNVVVINFSYDISVKVYASFLLGLFLLNLLPYAKFLYRVLVLNRTSEMKQEKPLFFTKNKLWNYGIKSILVLFILTESLFPFVKSGNYNDDTFSRPVFHGAYQVTNQNKEENNQNISQIFIHRQGYFITKTTKNKMQDYHLIVDTVNRVLKISRYDLNESYILNYEEKNKTLFRIIGEIKSKKIDVFLDKINLKNLPIKQSSFHWTTDH